MPHRSRAGTRPWFAASPTRPSIPLAPNASELAFAVQRQRGSPADPLGVNPIHQQLPKTPLLRSTNVGNAAHVDSPRTRTAYVGSTINPNLIRSRGTSLFVPPRPRQGHNGRNRGWVTASLPLTMPNLFFTARSALWHLSSGGPG